MAHEKSGWILTLMARYEGDWEDGWAGWELDVHYRDDGIWKSNWSTSAAALIVLPVGGDHRPETETWFKKLFADKEQSPPHIPPRLTFDFED